MIRRPTVGEFSCFSSITLLILLNIQWMVGLPRVYFSQFVSGSVQIPVAESDHETCENGDECIPSRLAGCSKGDKNVTTQKSYWEASGTVKLIAPNHNNSSVIQKGVSGRCDKG